MVESRASVLVGAALVLAALRFLVVPWISQQDERRQQLEVLTQRLDRSQAVVGKKDAILGAQAKLEAQVSEARERFPVATDVDQFRLDQQRRISTLATQRGLKVLVFDWLVSGDVNDAGLAFGRASVQVEGPVDRIIIVHGELEGSLPYAAVREFSMNPRYPAPGPTADVAAATFVVDLFYRPEVRPAAPPVAGTTS